MAPYPETETVTIKRIQVALKKKDWNLLKEGISKIQDKFSVGHRWEHFSNWQEIFNHVYDSDIPVAMKETFSQLLKHILDNNNEEPKEILFEQKELFNDENIVYPKLAVVYNETLDATTIKEIQRHRVNLNNISFNTEKFSPEPNWIKNISLLIQKLNKPNNELTEFMAVSSAFQGEKTLITNSYSAANAKNLTANKISYSLNDIKTDIQTLNSWKILTLGGSTNQFVCAECGNKILDTNFSAMAAASCSKCSGSMYPDLTDTSASNAQVAPKVWYHAFKELSKADIWVLMTPSSEDDKVVFRNLILDAAQNANPKRIYIISKKAGINEWWKNVLSEVLPEAKIMDQFTNIFMLLEEFKNTEMASPALYEA
jgi:rubrerythrin